MIIKGGLSLFAVAGLLVSFSGNGDSAMTKEFNPTSSSHMPLLQAHFSTEVLSAIGGPQTNPLKDGYLKAGNSFEDGDINKNISTNKDGIRTYIVQKGDNLSKIADRFNISVNTIKWENNIGNIIKPGQELAILTQTGIRHKVKKGDTLSKIAQLYEVEIADIAADTKLSIGEKIFIPGGSKRNQIPSSKKAIGTYSSKNLKSTKKVESGYYIRPLQGGRLTSKYGPRGGRYHYGLDFGAPRGTALVASAGGTVIKTITGCREGNSRCGGGYGNYVVIKHGNGTKTLYAHMQKVNVSYGQKLAQGEKIGTIGNTGRSTGPHTHFEIEQISNGKKIKPPFTW